MRIAIIPARGGSKRIPGKNIKNFYGKPMIAWSIIAAKESNLFDKIIVSSDSGEIAEIAKHYGAEVPFTRPQELSDDLTPTAPVLLHALEFVLKEKINPDFICCIYPTAPFLKVEYLQQGLCEIQKTKAPGALSVTTFDFPILRSFILNDEGSVIFNWPEYEMTRSQDLPEFYHDAGQFYWLKVEEFLKQKRLVMPGTRPIFLPRKYVQDLDTPEDWDVAELMAKIILK